VIITKLFTTAKVTIATDIRRLMVSGQDQPELTREHMFTMLWKIQNMEGGKNDNK